MAINTDDIYAWGNGSSGQIASPNLATHRTPIKVTLDPSPPDGVRIKQVSCGQRHTLVLLSNGDVYAFGNNFFAQLGYDFQTENYKENQAKPLLLKNVLHNKSVKQVACGDKHSLFLFEDGSLAAVGHNDHGQLGNDTRKESVVPKPVDLDCRIRQIACGNNHNVVISDAGEVYVWGHSKGCGHRHRDVLSPELKLPGHDVVQVAAGGYHSLALSKSGHIYAWGFGTDGQLGLRERVMTSSVPRRIRHQELRGSVSYVACGEAYSAALTSQGILYMWGKNSHSIHTAEPENKPYFDPVCVNHNVTGSAMTNVHSVQCGTWHCMALLGMPDWRPVDDDSGESDDDVDDDGMTSEGSESTSSTSRQNSAGEKAQDPLEDNPFGLPDRPEVSSAPPRHTGINKSTSTPKPITEQSSLPAPTRTKTKLTIGEFYEMTDSSPSQSKSNTPKSSPRSIINIKNDYVISPVPSLTSPEKVADNVDQGGDETNSGKHSRDTENDVVQELPFSSALLLCPEVNISSPTSSPDFSVVSECSLKKRMAENIEMNKGMNFKTRDWSGQRRRHHMSPMKPIVVTPSPENISPQGHLTPKASCLSKAASLTRRSRTMFISKSTADHFSLPREQTFFSRQNVSLMDLGNLRTGAVFDNQDNETPSRDTSAGGHFHSNSSSRLSMVSPYTDTELRDIFCHKSPDKTKDVFQPMMSMSDTPTNMIRYKRMKDMTSGLDQNGEKPLNQSHNILFATPSPSLGTGLSGDRELKQSIDMHMNRSKTTFGLSNGGGSNKYYRKPGFPGVDVKTKMARPGHLQGPSAYHTESMQNGKKDKSSGFYLPRTLSPLEITATSPRLGASCLPHADPLRLESGHNSRPTIDLAPRRARHPTGSVWRTKTVISHPMNKPEIADIGAFKSDGAFRKDLPDRPFHKNGTSSSEFGSSKNNVIMMKKGLLLEKAQTSLAISGAGSVGPKGQLLRQVNTSASSRNLRKK